MPRKASFSTLKPDLHLHSTASDGQLSPFELVNEAKKRGMTFIALTDHETMFGLSQTAQECAKAGIGFLPGVEINTAGEDEVHLLVYGVDDSMTELVDLLASFNADRALRGVRFIERFKELGIEMDECDLNILPGTFCNRPHVAHALVRLGHVSSVPEAFQRYLAVGRPGYIGRTKISTQDAIALARRCGCVPVLAHPDLIRKQELRSPEAIGRLKDAGLMGIEAYHSKHSPAAKKHWSELARKNDLLVTGGSDFHGFYDSHGMIGSHLDGWEKAGEDVDKLLACFDRHEEEAL